MPGLAAQLQARLNTYGEAAPKTKANKVAIGCDAVSIYGDWGLWRDEDSSVDLSRYRELESIGATYGWRDALSSSVFHMWNINVSRCIAACNAEKSCRKPHPTPGHPSPRNFKPQTASPSVSI